MTTKVSFTRGWPQRRIAAFFSMKSPRVSALAGGTSIELARGTWTVHTGLPADVLARSSRWHCYWRRWWQRPRRRAVATVSRLDTLCCVWAPRLPARLLCGPPSLCRRSIPKKFSCWVRPGVELVRARPRRPTMRLIADDLPTLERPANATSGKSPSGRKSSDGADSRNSTRPENSRRASSTASSCSLTSWFRSALARGRRHPWSPGPSAAGASNRGISAGPASARWR